MDPKQAKKAAEQLEREAQKQRRAMAEKAQRSKRVQSCRAKPDAFQAIQRVGVEVSCYW